MSTEEFASGDDPLDNAEYLRAISRRLRGISENLVDPEVKNELTDLALHLAQRAEALAPAHDESMPPGPGHEPHEDSEAALRQSRKMETMGRLTGGVMHDFNNLRTVIEGNLELIENMAKAAPEGGIELPRLRRLLEAAQRGLSSGGELTRRLLAFSRQEPPALRTIDSTRRSPPSRRCCTRRSATLRCGWSSRRANGCAGSTRRNSRKRS
jgi:signal transduction histidine kinase